MPNDNSTCQFTDDENACISRKIKIFTDEGKEQKQAVAAAINMCAPEKYKNLTKDDMDQINFMVSQGKYDFAGT